jgi:hypothetical protein
MEDVRLLNLVNAKLLAMPFGIIILNNVYVDQDS